MAEQVKNYVCPSCGASLSYSPGKEELHCEYCDGDFLIENLDALDEAEKAAGAPSKYDWDEYTPRSFGSEDSGGISAYNCTSCAAEIVGDEALGATVCPYCGSSNIIKKAFEGTYRPDYVIPFKFDKKKAFELFEKECEKLPFIPDEFRDKKNVEKTVGLYIPYWIFDCDAHSDMTIRAQRTHFWSDSRYNYTKTDHYRLFRNGSLSFAGVPHDASRKTDDTYTEALEPFDTSEAMEFDTAYLSGYFADKYDVEPDDVRPRMTERIKSTIESRILSTTSGYTGVIPEKSSLTLDNTKTRYALLPVYMIHIKYGGQNYRYAVNGQTGKIVGKYPICKKKRLRSFLLSFFASAAVIALLMTIFELW